MMAAVEVLGHSVTRFDIPPNGSSAGGLGLVQILLGASPGSAQLDLPAFWSPRRDVLLLRTLYQESMWAGAISIAITKTSSRSFDVEGDVPARVRRAQDMLLHFDSNRGWVQGLSKHLQAFLLTGNGAFLEVVRATGAPGSRILGLVHLDSLRVIRTGDEETPAYYRDKQGGMHALKAHQVIMLSDMPDQAETWNGVGHCAAERAYRAIVRLAAIEQYVYEKVSGRSPLALHILGGVSPTQIETAIAGAQQDASRKGLQVYMGAAMIPTLGDNVAPTVATIPLKELPDGFDPKEERNHALLTYADAIGLDPQDLQPLTGRALGTGAQSQVLDDKAAGKGLVAWRKAFEHALNEFVLDEQTTFAFNERDVRDEQRRAEVSGARATAAKTWVDAGAINGQQALQLGVDWDELPSEFLPEDATAGESLSDEEKPDSNPLNQAAPLAESAQQRKAAEMGDERTRGPVALREANAAYQQSLADLVDSYIGQLQLAGGDEKKRDEILAGMVQDLTRMGDDELQAAYLIGLAGLPLTPADQHRLQQLQADNASYLQTSFMPDFIAALERGDDLESFVSRIQLYAGAQWAAGWNGMGGALIQATATAALPIAQTVERFLDPNAKHCGTCPGKAGMYDSWEQMLIRCGGLPGDGSDECGSNCRCWLVVG